MIDDVMSGAKEKMSSAVEAGKRELAAIRTGRANPALFTNLMVDYYGAPTPLQQLASVTIPEARTVIINPFDRSAMKNIVTAIRESDLGVNPTDDGTVIRVSLERPRTIRRAGFQRAEPACFHRRKTGPSAVRLGGNRSLFLRPPRA